MKKQVSEQTKFLTLTLSVIALMFLTSCGKKTSSSTDISTNALSFGSTTNMANCNRLSDANFSVNIAAVVDATGVATGDWIKVKFQYLSSDITQSGYTLKFYKWRVLGGTSQLDYTPLQFSRFVLSNNQVSNEALTSVLATDVNQQYGYYVQLNDDIVNPYQALKIVAYKADGSVLAQSDMLIPQFSANPNEYRIAPDGSQRPQNLMKLHPLYAQDTSQWNAIVFQQTFNQYCF